MLFNLKSTTIYQAVKIAKTLPPKLVKLVNWLLLFIVLSLLIAFFGDKPLPGLSSSSQVLGLFLIILSFDILGWIWLMFFKSVLKKNIYLKPPLEEAITFLDTKDVDLAKYLDFDVTYALVNALGFCRRKKISLTALHVILFLFRNERVERIFEKLGLAKGDIKKALKKKKEQLEESKILYSETFYKIIKEAARQAVTNFHRQIELRDFLVAAAEYDNDFRKILFDNNLDPEDVDHVISWDDFITYQAEWKRKFWKLDNLLRRPGIGKQWAAGYTVNLDKYAIDVTKLIKKKGLSLHVVGRKKEIEKIERVLSRRGENNVLVIGRPGGGRSTIVYSFAKKVLEGRSISVLNYKRVLELDVQAMFAGLKTHGEILERFKIVFSEAANAGNIILIIDDIHNYIGMQEGVGVFDISSTLIPYLGSPELQIIGITTFESFHKNIETNPAVMNFFEKVEIEEPSKEETMFILEDLLPGFEKQYNLRVGYKGLRAVVNLTDRYIQDIPFPEKAIDFLGEVMVYVKTKTNSKVLLLEHAAQIISEKTKIPAGEIQKTEKEKLLNLEQFIHRRVIDQEEAVDVLADAMRRTRAGVAERKKPIGTFLFLGPTGVGKTETSKALAESYFGSEKRMIRLDMSEYQGTESIDRLIGSPDGLRQGQLTNAIRENPFSLILLDEMEKAHPKILNLFLQVLDEGRLTDSLGRTVSFRNSIIIGTSNAGAEYIREYVEKKAGYAYSFFKKELVEHLLREGIFRPEFLNRFDAVIIFKPLTRENLVNIAILMLQKLNKRLVLGRGIQFVVTKELAEKVAKLGYYPEFGARPMNRVIQDRIENKIATKILRGELRRGDMIEIKPEEI
jgi:ATP-dependent Clp protease ATP-binding subunit ClpC